MLPPSRSDAAALACLCRGARDAARGSRWRDSVRVSPVSGRVREPASGRFDVELPGNSNFTKMREFDTSEPSKAYFNPLADALAKCPAGGSILLSPGHHLPPGNHKNHEASAVMTRDIYVFGRGRAVIDGYFPSSSAFSCVACTAVLDGLVLHGATMHSRNGYGHSEGRGDCAVRVSAGGRLRLQSCHIGGLYAAGVRVLAGSIASVVGCRCGVILTASQ